LYNFSLKKWNELIGSGFKLLIYMGYMQDKGLEAHPDKTCFVVFGTSKFKDKIQEQLKTNPLYFGDFPVKRKNSKIRTRLGLVFRTNIPF
jgi:hypothetical protein